MAESVGDEFQALRDKEKYRVRVEKDVVIKRYISLIIKQNDPQICDLLGAEKARKLQELDDQLDQSLRDLEQKQLRLQQRSDFPSQARPSSSTSSPRPSRLSPVPKIELHSADEPVVENSAIQNLPQGRKRKASPESPARKENKHPRNPASNFSRDDSLHTPTSLSRSPEDLTQSRVRSPQTSPAEHPSQPSVVVCPRLPADIGRTVTYDQVHRRGTIENIWDTIVEHPRRPKKWYTLFCEEHEMHFKQNALAAAAKHLDGTSHGNQGRDRVNALNKLGYRVIDCTQERQAEHNADVAKAFANNYIPPCRKDSRKRKSLSNHSTRAPPSQAREKAQMSTAADATATVLGSSKSTQPGITSPKQFYIYNCKYDEKTGDGICVWPVLILGWDDLTPGGNISAKRLVDTQLLDPDSRPPRCYIYGELHDRIMGWSPEYDDAENASKLHQRKFPVMFFDDNQSYAWVPGKDLSPFPIAANSGPKKKGYKEKAFIEAREFIAQREGFSSWEDRQHANRNGRLVPWEPAQPLPQRASQTANPVRALQDKPRMGHQDLAVDEVTQARTREPSWMADDDVRAAFEKGGEIPGDGDYTEKSSEGDDTDSGSDVAMGGNGAPYVNDSFDTEWPPAYTLRSEKKAKKGAGHVLKDTADPDEPAVVDRAAPFTDTLKDGYNQMQRDMDSPAASAPIDTGPTRIRAFTAKRTSQTRHLASAPLKHAKKDGEPMADSGRARTEFSTQRPAAVIQPTKNQTSSSATQDDISTSGTQGKEAALMARLNSEVLNQVVIAAAAAADVTTTGGALSTETSTSKSLALAIPAADVSDDTYVFELFSYHQNGAAQGWTKAALEDSGIRLWEDVGKLRSRKESAIKVEVDAAAYGTLHLKSIPGPPGNSLITITGTEGETLQLLFDRAPGDEKLPSGKVQARNFVDWLREERRKRGLKLKTRRE